MVDSSNSNSTSTRVQINKCVGVILIQINKCVGVILIQINKCVGVILIQINKRVGVIHIQMNKCVGVICCRQLKQVEDVQNALNHYEAIAHVLPHLALHSDNLVRESLAFIVSILFSANRLVQASIFRNM